MSYLDQITVDSTTYDLQDSGAQRATLTGSTAPTTSTVGVVGQHYINTSATGHPYEYVCTNVSSGTYTWIPVDASDAPVTSVNNKTGAVVLTASDVGALPDSTSIPAPSNTTPAALGTASAGSASTYSRSDHVHAKPTYSKSDVGLGNVDNVQQYSASNPPPYPVTSVNGSTGDVTVSVPSVATVAPSNLAATAAVGTSSKYAKEDHVHKMPSASDVGALPSNTTYVSTVNGSSGAVTVVEDDHKWGGVELTDTSSNTSADAYVPSKSSTGASSGSAVWATATSTPGANKIAKYDSNSYLKSTTPSANDNSTKVATTAYVDGAIDDLPEPMVFKGSLGTGGTITTLPAASSSNTGFTYKVITDGTYASQSAKVGDTFISDGTSWVLIPSGDEPSGTVTSVGISNATDGGLSISNSPITSSGTISIGHSNVLTNAQTTQALYPIKIDKNGHISEYGSAVSIPSASSATPEDLGTASAGTSTNYSRADHVHTKPTYSKSDVGLGNVDNVKQYSASNPPPYPVTSVNGQTGTVTISVPSAATATPSALGTASAGSSTSWSRGDHVHPYPDIVYIGTSSPSDTNIELWLDTTTQGATINTSCVKSSITTSTIWTIQTNDFTQTVTLSSGTVTSNSKVDLQPDTTTLVQMMNDNCTALYIENNQGTLTLHALNAPLTSAVTIQVTVTEVAQ